VVLQTVRYSHTESNIHSDLPESAPPIVTRFSCLIQKHVPQNVIQDKNTFQNCDYLKNGFMQPAIILKKQTKNRKGCPASGKINIVT